MHVLRMPSPLPRGHVSRVLLERFSLQPLHPPLSRLSPLPEISINLQEGLRSASGRQALSSFDQGGSLRSCACGKGRVFSSQQEAVPAVPSLLLCKGPSGGRKRTRESAVCTRWHPDPSSPD